MKKKLITLLMSLICISSLYINSPQIIADGDDDEGTEYIGLNDKNPDQNPDATVPIKCEVNSIYYVSVPATIQLKYKNTYTETNESSQTNRYMIFQSDEANLSVKAKFPDNKMLNVNIIRTQCASGADGSDIDTPGIKLTSQDGTKALAYINLPTTYDSVTIDPTKPDYKNKYKGFVGNSTYQWIFVNEGKNVDSFVVGIDNLYAFNHVVDTDVNGYQCKTFPFKLTMRVLESKGKTYTGNMNFEISLTDRDYRNIPTLIITE